MLFGDVGVAGELGISAGVVLPVLPGIPGGLTLLGTLFGGKLLFGGKPGGLLGTVGFKLGGAPGVGKACALICVPNSNVRQVALKIFMMVFIVAYLLILFANTMPCPKFTQTA
jgi:hypothetical protein